MQKLFEASLSIFSRAKKSYKHKSESKLGLDTADAWILWKTQSAGVLSNSGSISEGHWIDDGSARDPTSISSQLSDRFDKPHVLGGKRLEQEMERLHQWINKAVSLLNGISCYAGERPECQAPSHKDERRNLCENCCGILSNISEWACILAWIKHYIISQEETDLLHKAALNAFHDLGWES